MVQFLVLENGTTTCIRVVQGIGRIFDQTSVNATKKVQFEPDRYNASPVVVQYAVPSYFKDPSLD